MEEIWEYLLNDIQAWIGCRAIVLNANITKDLMIPPSPAPKREGMYRNMYLRNTHLLGARYQRTIINLTITDFTNRTRIL